MTEGEHNFLQGHPELVGIEEDAEALRFSEIIGWLDREQLGRTIVIRDTGPESARVLPTDTSADTESAPAEARDTVIGISLELDNDRHLLVYKNGDMQVTEPRYQGGYPGTAMLQGEYREALGPNTTPLVMDRRDFRDIPDVVNGMSGVHGQALCKANVIDALRTEDDVPRFEGYSGQAVAAAEKRKVQHEVARKRGMRAFIDKFDKGMFKSPDVPPAPGPDRPTGRPPQQTTPRRSLPSQR